MLFALVLFPWMLPGAVGTKGPCLLCTELEVLQWAPAAFHTLSYSMNTLAHCVQEREGLEIPLQMLGCIQPLCISDPGKRQLSCPGPDCLQQLTGPAVFFIKLLSVALILNFLMLQHVKEGRKNISSTLFSGNVD